MTFNLSTDDQIALTGGADFLSTRSLGSIPSITMVDGPAGVRMQDVTKGADHLGLRPSIPATAFPLPNVLAQTWDVELMHRVGVTLGIEAQAAGVNVLLGPGINIRRDPRGGRNFEYYSEDPLLTGVLATAYVRGLQSQGVGASLKHFAANNTEHERFRSSSDIDPRPLREIYLRAFQRVVQHAQPWTVMCSYNGINGVPNAQNRWLLTEVLRGDWGFDGAVISDWGAVDDRAASIAAGLDLDMPADDGSHERGVRESLADGTLQARDLERSASRIAELALKAADASHDVSWDVDEHHAIAREVAAQGIVLLTNNGTLPLDRTTSLAVIGEFAAEPRFQGGGSSKVNATRVDIPLDELRSVVPTLTYARGFNTTTPDASLASEAITAASEADVAVVFLGIANRQESEGFDRESMEIPQDQLELLRSIRAAQPNTVVVLSHGGALLLDPLVEHASAILDVGLLGQAVGGAIADVLFGEVNPSGKLTETLPLRLEDVPSFTSFPGDELHVRYGEGIFVGYRGYDQRALDVAFPFGHGLSYTSFAYDNLRVAALGDRIELALSVTNTGERAGREIVQAYTALERSAVSRPPAELKAFGSVFLDAGETREVTLRIDRSDLAYWSTAVDGWVVEGGEYSLSVGSSSRDIRLTASIEVAGDGRSAPLTDASSVAEVLADPVAGAAFGQVIDAMFAHLGQSEAAGDGFDIARMIGSTPIRRFVSSLGGQISVEQLHAILDAANGARSA